MKVIDIRNQLPNKGSNGKRPLSDIVYAIIHHDGDYSRTNYKPLDRYIKDAKYHISRGWKRLSYHYRIDTRGNIYLANDLEEVLWHAGNYKVNKASIGICLDGDFRKHGVKPEQLKSLWELLDNLTTKRPDMPKLLKPTIKVHKKVKLGYTNCPSKLITTLINAYKMQK